MKISLDMRIVRDAQGKRALRVWPEIEATSFHKALLAAFIAVALFIASVAMIKTDVPDTKPTVQLSLGY